MSRTSVRLELTSDRVATGQDNHTTELISKLPRDIAKRWREFVESCGGPTVAAAAAAACRSGGVLEDRIILEGQLGKQGSKKWEKKGEGDGQEADRQAWHYRRRLPLAAAARSAAADADAGCCVYVCARALPFRNFILKRLEDEVVCVDG